MAINADDKKNPNVLWTVTYSDGKPREDIFVTWAWFEDQLLNRYTTFKAGDGKERDIKMTMRSIDTVLDDDGVAMTVDKWLLDKLAVDAAQSSKDMIIKKELGVDFTNLTEVLKTPTQIRYSPILFANNPFKFFISDLLIALCILSFGILAALAD